MIEVTYRDFQINISYELEKYGRCAYATCTKNEPRLDPSILVHRNYKDIVLKEKIYPKTFSDIEAYEEAKKIIDKWYEVNHE